MMAVAEQRDVLLSVLMKAHETAARNNTRNLSNIAVGLTAQGSGSFAHAVIAGIAATGQHHAPITEARRIIYREDLDFVERCLSSDVPLRSRIAGWGNSFHKEGVDPSWLQMDAMLRTYYPDDHELLVSITKLLHAHGKMVWPNAAAYTAVVAELIDMPWGTELTLLLIGRLPVWAQIFSASVKGTR